MIVPEPQVHDSLFKPEKLSDGVCALNRGKAQDPFIDGTPFVCLAAHVQSFLGGRVGYDCRNCQTVTATPAEPGELPRY
jgi:hypothetical protein